MEWKRDVDEDSSILDEKQTQQRSPCVVRRCRHYLMQPSGPADTVNSPELDMHPCRHVMGRPPRNIATTLALKTTAVQCRGMRSATNYGLRLRAK